ncbi:polyprenyl synthetase family protein [Streptomyces tremellae]|uniref:Family 2 encapsulin nanocompartment cargo protein polyprenyl transferase n=1 Tax=Streptomyces tremellae TaxID=1124239 RepID=A0ABP7E4X0_9ACTN
MEPSALDSPDHVVSAARDMLMPQLREVVGRIPPPLHTPCAYQFGLVDATGQEVAYRGPTYRVVALVLLSAGAEEDTWQRAREVALACALIHGYAFICDDIIDGDLTRRGFPSVWRTFGTATAILAADLLLTTALSRLAELETPASRAAAGLLSGALQGGLRAQALEGQYEQRGDVSLQQALDVVDGKTSDWVAACCEAGALQAGTGAERAPLMRSYGWHVGRVIQLRDDVVDVFGEKRTAAPPKRDDLRTRKKSSIVCAALESGHALQDELASYYRRPHGPQDSEIDRMAALVDQCGGRDWAERQITRHLRQAHSCAHRAADDPRAAELMCDYADMFADQSVGDRTFHAPARGQRVDHDAPRRGTHRSGTGG